MTKKIRQPPMDFGQRKPTMRPELPPPPPDPNLLPNTKHFKRTTIQFRNFNQKKPKKKTNDERFADDASATTAPGEGCKHYLRHHGVSRGHSHKPRLDTGLHKKSEENKSSVGNKNKVKDKNDENINNLNNAQQHPLQAAVNVETGEVMLDQVYIVPDEEMQKITAVVGNTPPSTDSLACQELRPPTPHRIHKSEIPLNARKKVYNHVGWLGIRGDTGAADPTKFVKKGSGRTSSGDHPKVSDYKNGEKPTKWTRPLHEGFVPKLGRPKPNSPKKPDDNSNLPKRNFLADNKESAKKVVVSEKGPKVIKKEKLGIMPDYLVKRRMKEKFEFEKAVKEEKQSRRKAREKKSMDERRKMELLDALKKRLAEVVLAMEVCRSDSKKKKMDVEVKALDADINKLERADIINILKNK